MSLSLEDAKGAVGKGWHGLLESLYACKPEGVEVVQVKEKFGELRFYCHCDEFNRDYLDIVDETEQESRGICEECGQPGETVSVGGWLKTRCAEHCPKNTVDFGQITKG